MGYNKLNKKVEFDIYYQDDDDHILYIKKADYDDIDLYYVIMEDAYRTPTTNIMSASRILKEYGINIKE